MNIPEFENLSDAEVQVLMRAPALISVLAASHNHEISDLERAEAIKLSHLKTFTAKPILIDYYNEVVLNFKNHFEEIAAKYEPLDDSKIVALKEEAATIYAIVAKLKEPYSSTLKASLMAYARHIKKVDKNFVENYLFPFMN